MFGNENEVERKITIRREVVFVVLSGLFLGTLAVLNILGISRQIDLSRYLQIDPNQGYSEGKD
ncbi:MAG: hypothetical protein KAT15_08760 [Bacteroidales bacterium]|nr:hypothetical protein [Bacteroidales bacterium]